MSKAISYHRRDSSYYNKEEYYVLEHYIYQKVIMIFHTYAIINPWAVMVKSFNTSITDTAMPTPYSPYCFTIWT